MAPPLLSLAIAAALLPALIGLAPPAAAEDPYLYFDWKVTYGTRAPLGVNQKVILINNEFPGPRINCSSNNNIVLNIHNNLDEPLLFTWNGIQQRKNSWVDGMPGTNCPIPPGKNFTLKWQAKDQIGSFFYFPSTGMLRAAGGYGLIRINSRLLIPVPFDDPADDYTALVGDWYNSDHAALERALDSGRGINRADGFIINGKNDKKNPQVFTVQPRKTYRFRVCNVGIRDSINFRIQNHILKLVEMDGSHTVQNLYDSLDVHVGQCASVLITANQKPGDYHLVASSRFVKEIQTATALVRYAGSKSPASKNIPVGPDGWAWSLNQWRSFKWNLTASAARPNPQGSYHYGQINITRTIQLESSRATVNGKLRYALNGISHVDPKTPLKLAEYFGIAGKVFKYDAMPDAPPAASAPVKLMPNVITAKFRTFIEVIFQNPEKSIQSYHLNGYAFFPVGMGPGKWTPQCRDTYNLLDAVSRHTIQVYPNSWTAMMTTFDNAGMWNIRSNIWERYYLGQQLYVSVLSPEKSLRDEYNMPESILLCGDVAKLPIPKPVNS